LFARSVKSNDRLRTVQDSIRSPKMNTTVLLAPSNGTAVPSKTRRLPVGAEVIGNKVSFRVWAPCRVRVEVVLEKEAGAKDSIALSDEGAGYFSGTGAAR